MSHDFSHSELEAYLDEALPVERMAEVEEALRCDEGLRERLKATIGRRDAGVHTLGGIWRRHRLSCPARIDLGSYLLGALTADHEDYVRFHLEVLGCRVCRASVVDLESAHEAADVAATQGRRKKYFQSSVGHLPRE